MTILTDSLADSKADSKAGSKVLLAVLRQKMRQKNLDYYLVGSSDPHNNESVSSHWRYLAELSGFTGSLGYLLVSQDFAGLWVDSRYHIQAGRECLSQIQVFRIGRPGVEPLHEYWQQCLTAATRQLRLGFDGTCFSRRNLSKLLSVTAASDAVVDGENLLTDELWTAPSRPPSPQSPVFSYELNFCGQSRADKIRQVRAQMQAAGYDYYPVLQLDGVAWLLNVRASDIAYNPVAISYLLLGRQSLCWYIEESRLTAQLRTELRSEIPTLEIKPYQDFYADCRVLIEAQPSVRFLLTERCNMRLLDILLAEERQAQGEVRGRDKGNNGDKHLEKGVKPCPPGRDIITDLKAIKNATEQEQLRRVMAIDGAAVVAFHNWLRPRPNAKLKASPVPQQAEKSQCNEHLIAQKLVEFRRQVGAERAKGESFAPIVGFGENSALPHYSAPAEGSRAVGRHGGWLLIDSGGQYLGGTTDMTRCFSLEADFAAPRFNGCPSAELRRIYTLVLRGHLHLQNSRFPQGTLGVQLDTLARSPLWSEGLNYQHGTGHGVGSFLNVHEDPISISPAPLNEPLKAGMLLSDEPGYYRENAFGIRIENLLLVQVDQRDPDWLCFEPVTVFPYERELIVTENMTRRELLWVDQYHALCLERILSSGKLNAEQEDWLRWRCAPLEV